MPVVRDKQMELAENRVARFSESRFSISFSIDILFLLLLAASCSDIQSMIVFRLVGSHKLL